MLLARRAFSARPHFDQLLNVAHLRQSRPDDGPGFQVNVLKTFSLLPLRAETGSSATLEGN